MEKVSSESRVEEELMYSEKVVMKMMNWCEYIA